MSRKRNWLLCGALLVLSLVPFQTQAQPAEACFEQTGFCVQEPILSYWRDNGGLAVFGYPITDLREETVEGVWTGPVQWFERDRLEDHTADGEGVLAGRLGATLLELEGRPWTTLPQIDESESPAGCRYFEQTRHAVCPPFIGYWEQNGGLERFGYPISEAREENIGGWTGTVQYFERRRLEHHIENRGTPFEVLLGLLGREVLAFEPEGLFDTSGQIAFTSSRTGNKEIWVMDGSGANPRQITDNPGADDFQPAWSPDGSQIAYVMGTEATANQDIWVMDADGSNARKLSDNAAADWEPTWSADGSRIAFVSERTGDADIFVRNADGSGEDINLTTYAPDSAQYSPAWSPDGTRIAYISTEDSRPALWIMTVDAGERIALTRADGFGANYPTWTPDSARILFHRGNDIWFITPDGQSRDFLTNTNRGTHPTVSPDGTTLAYESQRRTTDIFVTTLDGQQARNLTDSPGSVDQDPDWR